PAGNRIQPIQSVARGEPQHAVPVLSDVLHVSSQASGIVGIGAVVEKPSSNGIEAVQFLIDGDPQRAGAVLQQRVNEDSANTVGVAGFGLVGLKAIAVEAVQPVVRAEPQEALIVLQDVVHAALGESLFG